MFGSVPVRVTNTTVGTPIPRTMPYVLSPTRHVPNTLCGEVRPYWSGYQPLLTPTQLRASNWEPNPTPGFWPQQCAWGPLKNTNLWF